MIPPLKLGRFESSWLNESFVASAFATSLPTTLLGKATLIIRPDEIGLYQQNRVHLARLRWETFWLFSHMRTIYIYKNRFYMQVVGWTGDDPLYFLEISTTGQKQQQHFETMELMTQTLSLS